MKIYLCVLLFCLLSLSICSQTSLTVTSKSASVRENPALTSKTVGVVKKGQTFTSMAAQGGWYYISRGVLRGWIYKDLVVTAAQIADVDEYIKSQLPPPPPGDFEKWLKETRQVVWVLWGTYKGDRIYYQNLIRDRDSVKVWVKRRAVMGRINFDCSSASLTMLAAVANGHPYDEWESFYEIKPKTFGEWLYDKACS